ncbi:hypothetical protein AAH450_03345 [Erwinia sp. P7711]|uniref:DprA-like winged helix domain-containing protein n=1 Tax=Erwinia sp. P7711 TaxID=3141451 RepID=UPI003184A693
MIKQPDMTESSEAVLHFLSPQWTTVSEISQIAGMTPARCQLILTQLVMAGMAEEEPVGRNTFRCCEKSQ